MNRPKKGKSNASCVCQLSKPVRSIRRDGDRGIEVAGLREFLTGPSFAPSWPGATEAHCQGHDVPSSRAGAGRGKRIRLYPAILKNGG